MVSAIFGKSHEVVGWGVVDGLLFEVEGASDAGYQPVTAGSYRGVAISLRSHPPTGVLIE
jgi:hypothetical protein